MGVDLGACQWSRISGEVNAITTAARGTSSAISDIYHCSPSLHLPHLVVGCFIFSAFHISPRGRPALVEARGNVSMSWQPALLTCVFRFSVVCVLLYVFNRRISTRKMKIKKKRTRGNPLKMTNAEEEDADEQGTCHDPSTSCTVTPYRRSRADATITALVPYSTPQHRTPPNEADPNAWSLQTFETPLQPRHVHSHPETRPPPPALNLNHRRAPATTPRASAANFLDWMRESAVATTIYAAPDANRKPTPKPKRTSELGTNPSVWVDVDLSETENGIATYSKSTNEKEKDDEKLLEDPIAEYVGSHGLKRKRYEGHSGRLPPESHADDPRINAFLATRMQLVAPYSRRQSRPLSSRHETWPEWLIRHSGASNPEVEPNLSSKSSGGESRESPGRSKPQHEPGLDLDANVPSPAITRPIWARQHTGAPDLKDEARYSSKPLHGGEREPRINYKPQRDSEANLDIDMPFPPMSRRGMRGAPSLEPRETWSTRRHARKPSRESVGERAGYEDGSVRNSDLDVNIGGVAYANGKSRGRRAKKRVRFAIPDG